MAIETVRVAILSNDLVPVYVDNVVVRVFDDLNVFVTSAMSGEDEPGIVEFELPGGTTPLEYQLRFYLAGARISPKRIEVFSPASLASTATNEFLVVANVFTLDASIDPNMCRTSGIVTGPSGRTRPGVDLIFTPRFNAFVDRVAAALPGRFIVRTDKYGFATADLYRYGIYDVTIAGREDVTRVVEVPDRPSILLAHLLFPVVASVTYAEAGPYSVAVDGALYLTPQVRSTAFQNLGVGAEDVQYSVLDANIASVQISGDRIVVRGHAAGSTTIRVTRLDNSVVYLPDLGISGADVSITVV